MKFLWGLLLTIAFIAYLLSLFKSDSLIQIYCRNQVQRLTPKKVDEGFKFRDRETEEEQFEICVEENEGENVLRMLVLYAQLPTLSADNQFD